ncbi:hypothetical protein V8C37DRAFT_384844 [Trichoderma ceciliae]
MGSKSHLGSVFIFLYVFIPFSLLGPKFLLRIASTAAVDVDCLSSFPSQRPPNASLCFCDRPPRLSSLASGSCEAKPWPGAGFGSHPY